MIEARPWKTETNSGKEIRVLFLPFVLAFAFLTYWVQDNGFFWDTISQASGRAHWFYQTDFRYFFLPAHLDSGHPVFFNQYLALCWKLFGKTMVVSHWAVFPFLLGILREWARLCFRFLPTLTDRLMAMAALASLPFFLGQSVLVSPDLVLLYGFLLAVNALFLRRTFFLMVALLLINAVSLRGLFTTVALGLTYLFIYRWVYREKWLRILSVRNLWPFLLTGLLAGIYYYVHYQAKGWWLSTPSSHWAHHRDFTGPLQWLRKLGILGWRLNDYGFLIYWLAGGVLAWLHWRKLPRSTGIIFGIAALVLLAYLPGLIFLNNPIAHRYLLPVYLMVLLGTIALVVRVSSYPRLWLTSFLAVSLLGNLWVYPRDIAQGWDATLAHIPYYILREEMLVYMEQQAIPIESTGSTFPNLESGEIYRLNGDPRKFREADPERDPYIFYSNVMNDFSDETLAALEKWDIVHVLESPTVEVILYKNPDLP